MLNRKVEKVEKYFLFFANRKMDEPLNYVRVYRKRACLSLRELGDLVGSDPAQVSKHERSSALPTLLTAVGYSIVFHAPVSDIFNGLHESLTLVVEKRIAELEVNLRQHSGKGVQAALTARKLEWLQERLAHSQSHR